jgi:hypothetical protein
MRIYRIQKLYWKPITSFFSRNLKMATAVYRIMLEQLKYVGGKKSRNLFKIFGTRK